MATILVVGTYALDYVGNFPKSFAQLPPAEALNISLQLGGLKKGFGGCGMNISVMLHKLGHHAIPFSYVGNQIDADYASHLVELGVDLRGLQQTHSDELPSHALIVTDAEENQFTAFYPGAPKTNFRDDLAQTVHNIDAPIEFVVIAPDAPEYMIAAAELCVDLGYPFICDPGQCTTAFNQDDCVRLIDLSDMITMNRYEYEIFSDHVPSLENNLSLMIVTQGAEGVKWHLDGKWSHERAAVPHKRVDPTGCGDAFRSGLVHAHVAGASWIEAIRTGCVLATINLEHQGTQFNSVSDLQSRYEAEWSEGPRWLNAEAADV